MPESTTRSVGMDVHKASIAVASVARDRDAHVIDRGTIGTRQAAIDHRIRQRHAKATPLVVVYEAGPGGDWRYRYRRKKGYGCGVVAPSLIPQTAGDRVKTDRRDAVQLARFMRSGERPPVYVPTVDDEASCALCRAREAAIADLKAAQFRLKAVWLRHDIRETGPATWGPAHRRWLSTVGCPTPAQPMGFQADVRAVTAHTERLPRLAQARHEHVTAWRLRPGGCGAAGRARGAVDRGRHHGRGTGRRDPRREPQTAHEVSRADPLGRCYG
jgi:transposase